MNKKDKIQSFVKNQWLETNKFGVVILGTGVGKSKLGTDVIKEVYDEVKDFDIPILIGVDKVTNRDITWVEELKKWGVDTKLVKIECYQSIYKWKDKNIGLFIADELDVALTEEYSKSFFNNNITMFLGLTATITKEKEQMLNKFAPIFFRFSSEDSQEAGLINHTVIIEHYVPLNTVKNIKTKYGFWSEASKYKWFSDKITKNDKLIQDNIIKSKSIKKFIERQAALNLNNPIIKSNKSIKIRRAKFLKELESLDLYSMALKKALLKTKDNKVLLFSKFTKTIDKFGNSYHYKNKKNNDNIEKFNNDEINYLGVCKTVSRGVSFTKLNHIIGHSYDGTDTYYTQALQGRATRLDVTQLAFIHILIPIYNDGKEEFHTRAYDWYNEMTINVKPTNKYKYDGRTVILKYCEDIEKKRKEI